jgi:hypothetical protein
MTSIGTRVDGDPGSVRTAATGVAALTGGIGGAGDAFGSATGLSELQWTGSAGDAFRGKITNARQATAAAAASGKRIQTAMHTFADQLDQAKATVKQATAIATGAGLTVSADTVRAPTPPVVPSACYTPAGATQAATAFAAAEAKYRKQVAAYHQAEGLIKQARAQETKAHQALQHTAEEEGGILDELTDEKYWLAGGNVADAVGRGLEQTSKWDEQMDRYAKQYSAMRQLADESDDPLLKSAATQSAQDSALDTTRAAANAESNDRLGLGADPESGLGTLLKNGGRAVVAAQIADDLLTSKHKVRDVAADGASVAVGEGASAAIESLSLAGAPETLGLSLLAGAAAFGTGYAVKHYGPAAWNWTEHAATNAAGWTKHAATDAGNWTLNAGANTGKTIAHATTSAGGWALHQASHLNPLNLL